MCVCVREREGVCVCVCASLVLSCLCEGKRREGGKERRNRYCERGRKGGRNTVKKQQQPAATTYTKDHTHTHTHTHTPLVLFLSSVFLICHLLSTHETKNKQPATTTTTTTTTTKRSFSPAHPHIYVVSIFFLFSPLLSHFLYYLALLSSYISTN